MQGLADGYFVLPYTIGDYLAGLLGTSSRCPTDDPVFKAAEADVDDRVKRLPVGQAAPSPSTTSTASSARSCGTTAAWRATEAGLEKALSEIPALREEFWKDVRVLGDGRDAQPVAREGRPGRRLLRAGRAHVPRRPRPRGVAAAATSATSTRPTRARPQRDDEHFAYVGGVGVDRRRRHAQGSTRSRSSSSTSTSPSGATSEDADACSSRSRSGARTAPTRAGQLRDVRRRRHQRGHVVPRDARRRQRAADRRRPGADRLRPRLPRGHLRHLRADDQRPGPRPAAGHGHLPAPHAQVRRRRRDHDRAVAGRRVPDHQGPHRRPRRRSTASSRPAATSRADTGAAPDANLIPIPKPVADAAMDAAACIGCGACVAACPNGAGQLFTSAKLAPPQPAAPGPGRALAPHRGRWSRRMEEFFGSLHEPRRVPGGVPEGDLASTSSPT